MPILKKELEEHARLSDVKDRQYLVWVIEIAKRGELKKRSWYLKNINGDFLEGCPDIESFEIG
jgi:hypothetical protein